MACCMVSYVVSYMVCWVDSLSEPQVVTAGCNLNVNVILRRDYYTINFLKRASIMSEKVNFSLISSAECLITLLMSRFPL